MKFAKFSISLVIGLCVLVAFLGAIIKMLWPVFAIIILVVLAYGVIDKKKVREDIHKAKEEQDNE